jgi:hypothetical protein
VAGAGTGRNHYEKIRYPSNLRPLHPPEKECDGPNPEQITKTMNGITNTLSDFFPEQPHVCKEITMGDYSVALRYIIFEQPIPQETLTKLSKSFRIN